MAACTTRNSSCFLRLPQPGSSRRYGTFHLLACLQVRVPTLLLGRVAMFIGLGLCHASKGFPYPYLRSLVTNAMCVLMGSLLDLYRRRLFMQARGAAGRAGTGSNSRGTGALTNGCASLSSAAMPGSSKQHLD